MYPRQHAKPRQELVAGEGLDHRWAWALVVVAVVDDDGSSRDGAGLVVGLVVVLVLQEEEDRVGYPSFPSRALVRGVPIARRRGWTGCPLNSWDTGSDWAFVLLGWWGRRGPGQWWRSPWCCSWMNVVKVS